MVNQWIEEVKMQFRKDSKGYNKTIVCISGDINGDFEDKTHLREYLRILDKYNVKATFPTTLDVAEKYTERIKLILKGGHEIAGHGDVHKKFYGTLQEQTERLRKMVDGFFDIFGVELKGFRAPWCKWDRNTHAALSKVGLKYDSSIKRLEILFRLPYIRKKNMNVRHYGYIKPFLRLSAQLYNITQKSSRYPYIIAPDLLEIPVLGYSDHYLISSPKGPGYTELDIEKIGSVWLENLKCIGNKGGVIVINAHPGFFSPDYVGGLDYFIENALKNGTMFETLKSIAFEFSKIYPKNLNDANLE